MRPILEFRARVLASIDAFFRRRDFLAVETPIRTPAPAPEAHIEAIPSGGWYLASSPELHMKRLLAAGYPRIFQLSRVFRGGERGRNHNPEFTLLEWYRAGASYLDAVEETEALVAYVAAQVTGGTVVQRLGKSLYLAAPWERLMVAQAFQSFAGWDPGPDPDPERFTIDLVEKVEPMLGRERPTVLLDYPASLASLARLKPEDPRVAERFEVYAGGLELANGFGELTDASEQRRRFEREITARRVRGRPIYPMPEAFLESMATMPRCSGVALGVDRLVMLLCDAASIEEVMAFTEETA